MTSISDLTTFLAPVAKEVTDLLGLQPNSGYDSSYTDSKVVSLANVAFSQVENFLRRKILFGDHTEKYRGVCQELSFKNIPVTDVLEVRWKCHMSVDWTVLVPIQDPPVVDGYDYWFDTQSLYFKTLYIYNFLEVDLQGGFEDVTDDADLYNGLVLQTAALYNRKESLGLNVIHGSTGKGSIASDRGSLIENAKAALEPLVYYGSVEDLK